MSSFNQGTPSVNTLINSSNCIVLGNTTSGTALTVQQLGAGSVASFSNANNTTLLTVGAQNIVSNTQIATGGNGTLVVGNLPLSKDPKSGYDPSYDDSAQLSVKSLTGIGTYGVGNLRIGMSSNTTAASFGYAYLQGNNTFIQTIPISLQPYGGNVGIGTASPGAPLDVFKSTNQIFVASSDTSGVYPKVAIGTGGAFDRNAYLNIYGTESSAQTGLSSNHVMTITNFSGSGYNSGDAPSSICFRQRWWSGGSGIEAVGGLRGIKTSTDGNTGGGVQLLYFSSTLQPGLTLNNSGNVGIGLTGPSYQLDLSTDGARKLTSTTWLTGSDQRIKTDIESANLQMCYDTVKSIDLKYFKWNFPTDSNVVPDDKHSLGFIAQEIQKVFPNAVSESNSYGYTDFLSLNTDQILKAMYGALKQTMADKEALEQSLSSLEQRLAAAGL